MAAPAERADNTATSLGRQAPVRSRSLGWCSPGRLTAARVDSTNYTYAGLVSYAVLLPVLIAATLWRPAPRNATLPAPDSLD